MHGHMVVQTFDSDTLLPCERVESDNVICAAGLTVLLAGLLWSSIEDQNANMGNPFNVTYVAPIYGAIGTGQSLDVNGNPTGPPTTSVTDTALVNEVSRVTATQAGFTAASSTGTGSLQWLFLFPAPTTNLTITEAGVFTQAQNITANGSLLDHAVINPFVTQTASQLLTLSVTLNFG
jgi:hypothetical protein